MGSLLIRNGTLVTSDASIKEDILIVDGKIHSIGKDLSKINTDTKLVDADSFYIFPGAIDPHVHMELPFCNTVSSDNFETGSIAALAGGTTTIIDFVTPARNESIIKSLYERKELAKKSYCDYAFHMSLTGYNDTTYNEMRRCIEEEGITSFKVYLAYKDTIGVDDKELISILDAAKNLKALITLHCEHGDMVAFLRDKYFSEGKIAPEFHPLSRPPELEGEAVHRVIILSKITGTPIYVVHVSTKNGLDEIYKAQQNKQVVFAETCPQYLLLNEDEYLKPFHESAAYVMSPPLRSKIHSDALWKGMKEGVVNTIGTDHCPFNSTGQKEIGKNDFRKIPNGAPGVENRLELLYTFGVLENKITLNQFVDMVSTKPSKIFGLYPQKGEIAKGADADLVIWDPAKEKTITSKTHLQNCDTNIYEGFRIKGSVDSVILNGEIVFKDGNFIKGSGRGKYIYRKNPFLTI
jgi:dihydropyrimidinase